MKKVLTYIMILSCTTLSGRLLAKTDNHLARNSVSLMFGGSGIYTSVIYERSLLQEGKFQFGAKGGVGISPFRLTFPEEFHFPLGIVMVYGQNKHHLDLSLNLTNSVMREYDADTESSQGTYKALFVPTLAYRYQKPEGGLSIKFGISPLIYFNKIKTTISPWIELGAGWSF